MARKKKDATTEVIQQETDITNKNYMSSINAILRNIDKVYGKGIQSVAKGVKAFKTTKIPTGSFSLDVELGGGIPEEKITVLAGPESSGKTTMALKMMANAQQRYPDRMGVWVEWENTLDLDWAVQQGVDLDRLIILQPETTEQGMDMIDALIRSKGAHLIVVDSIAAMLPSKELEISFEDATMGLAGQLNSRFFRKITQALRYHRSLTEENPAKTTVLLTNQLRDKLGSYGNPEIMPGGKALRYHSAVIVWLRQGDFLTKKVAGKDVKIGQVVNFRSKKNKTSAPQREGEFDYYFTRSNGFEPGQIDRAKEIITYAILWGVIRKNHGWYYIGEDGMNGKEAVYEYLMNNPEKRKAIEATVLEIAATQELKEDEEDDTDN